MWNKIACNRLIHQKTQLKERQRHEKQLRTTKSSFSLPQATISSFNCKSKQMQNDRSGDIDRQNQLIANRIRSVKSMRSSTSLNKYCDKSKILTKNRQLAKNMKKKQIEQENQRILKRLLTTSSSLKKYRIKTCENYEQNIKYPSLRGKTVMALSQNDSIGKQRRFKKMKTQIATEVQSRIEEIPMQEGYLNEQEIPGQQIQYS